MNDALCAALLAATGTDREANGVYSTGLPGLHVIRGDAETPLRHQLYEPALIVVAQGAKETLVGDRRFVYRAGHYLVLSVGLPVLAKITDARAERPYLALALTIDRAVVVDLMREIGVRSDPAVTSARLGLFVGTVNASQADAATRLAALLATPEALRVLGPGIAREFFYWTLTAPDGAEIARLAAPDSHTRRIADAIELMRATYAETVPIERLAATAHMSPSSFHEHFKLVTSMSPLQYQKQLRLLEARRLMLVSGADATRAAYHVGYESASQFSREYARMFGAPPRRDIEAFRAHEARSLTEQTHT